MRTHFNSARTVSSLENAVKTLPFDKAGEKACPLKPPPKITNHVTNVQENPVTETQR